jgi:hypothetical protein
VDVTEALNGPPGLGMKQSVFVSSNIAPPSTQPQYLVTGTLDLLQGPDGNRPDMFRLRQ